jgi:two-component system chemotaxis response regulator CheY
MLKLLVVDDSNIIRSKIVREQNLNGIKVVATAKNGRDAINVFQHHLPDLVTMDLTMPEIDGIECIETFMTIKPDVRILVISALSDKATGIEALHKGAVGFLLKPFTEAQLNEALL